MRRERRQLQDKIDSNYEVQSNRIDTIPAINLLSNNILTVTPQNNVVLASI